MKEGFSWGLNEMFDNSLNELVNWLFLTFPILRHNPTALSTGKKQKTNKKNHCQQESLAQV